MGLRKPTPRELVNIRAVYRQDGTFTKKYEITDLVADGISNIHLTVVSGASSFVDYLIFRSEENQTKPAYHYWQLKRRKRIRGKVATLRLIKGAPNLSTRIITTKARKLQKYMIYTHQGILKLKRMHQFHLAMKLKIFNGVSIVGKNLPPNCYSGWTTIEELIQEKNSFAKQFGGSNVPLRIWHSPRKGYLCIRSSCEERKRQNSAFSTILTSATFSH